MASNLDISLVIRAFNQASGTIRQVQDSLKGLSDKGKALRVTMAGAAAIGGGFAILAPLRSATTAAADLNEHVQYLKTALDSGAAGQRELAQATDLAQQASVKFNTAQTDIIDNLYKSISYTGDWATAMAVTQNSLAVAKGGMGDAAEIGKSLSIVWNDFGNKAAAAAPQVQHFADLIAYTSRHGAFANVSELMSGFNIAIGGAKAAGMSIQDLLATLQAFSAVGMGGTEAGSALNESLAAFARGKLASQLGVALATTKTGALDVIGTFVNLRRELGQGVISVEQFQRAAKALGIRGERALAINVDDLVKFRQTLDSASVNGAAMQGATTMMGAFQEQTGALGRQFDALKIIVGNSLLGPLTTIAHVLTTITAAMTSFASKHSEIVKFAAVFAAISATLLVVGGTILTVVGGFALLAGAIGISAGVAAAVGGIGAAIAGVGAFIATFHSEIAFVFGTIADSAKAVGADIWNALTWPFRELAKFIEGTYGAVKSAMGGVAHVISRFIKGGSPIPEGPLHDLNLGRDLAYTLRPDPLIAKMRTIAAAVAISAPMMLAPSMAMAGPAASGDSGATVIHYSPTIHIAAATGDAKDVEAAVMAANRKHLDELVRLIDARKGRSHRLIY